MRSSTPITLGLRPAPFSGSISIYAKKRSASSGAKAGALIGRTNMDALALGQTMVR